MKNNIKDIINRLLNSGGITEKRLLHNFDSKMKKVAELQEQYGGIDITTEQNEIIDEILKTWSER